MSVTPDITPYLKDPGLLLKLCREVIKHLDSSIEKPDLRENEAQLREITRAIERLEKADVAVPDALRSEKTRLVAVTSVSNKTSLVLNQLLDEFENIANELKERLGRSSSLNNENKPKRKHSRSPITDSKMLQEHIIKALKKLGGSAPINDVIEEMEKMLDGKFLPRDLEWRNATNEPVWQNNTRWERQRMKKQGILKSNSHRGIWELSEEYL